MIIGGIILVCVALAVLAFLFPRLSTHPQRGVDSALSTGQNGAGKAPGKLGKWLSKPFGTSRKATSRSAAAGRRGRSKLPL